jgi:predicted nucleic acid-binding protein
MYRWADEEHFVWLYTEDILAEYKEVLRRLHVRHALIGAFINLVRERGEAVEVRSESEISPDPKDDPFCASSEAGQADIIFTLNPKDFPQSRLKAKVLAPTPAKAPQNR